MHRSGPVVRTRAGVNGSCAIVGQRRLGGVRRCPRTAATCVFFLVFLKAGHRFFCAAAIPVLPAAEIVRFLGRCISRVGFVRLRAFTFMPCATSGNRPARIGVLQPELPSVTAAVEQFLEEAAVRNLAATTIRNGVSCLKASCWPFCDPQRVPATARSDGRADVRVSPRVEVLAARALAGEAMRWSARALAVQHTSRVTVGALS